MRSPTKKQIEYLRLAINMTGVVRINEYTAELILIVLKEMKRLGGSYSLKDAAKIAADLEAKHKKDDTSAVK
jgi:hypothetical protein